MEIQRSKSARGVARSVLLAVLIGIGGVICLAGLGRQRLRKPASRSIDPGSAALIDPLDRALQERFRDLRDNRFGISRVATTPEHSGFRSLKAESPAARDAVVKLRAARWMVLFYVAGRSSAPVARRLAMKDGRADQPSTPRSTPPGTRNPFGGRVISDPIAVTGGAPKRALPTEAALLQGLAGFWPDGRPMAFRTGEWQVFVRPIPLSGPKCLRCHSARSERWTGLHGPVLKVGDPAGAAVYALAPAPAAGGAWRR